MIIDFLNENSSNAIQRSTTLLHSVNLTFNMRTSHISFTPMGQSWRSNTQKNGVEVSDQVENSDPCVLRNCMNGTLTDNHHGNNYNERAGYSKIVVLY